MMISRFSNDAGHVTLDHRAIESASDGFPDAGDHRKVVLSEVMLRKYFNRTNETRIKTLTFRIKNFPAQLFGNIPEPHFSSN